MFSSFSFVEFLQFSPSNVFYRDRGEINKQNYWIELPRCFVSFIMRLSFQSSDKSFKGEKGCFLFSLSNRPIAKIFFIFFLESTFKNKLKSKISEFLAHSLIFNSNYDLKSIIGSTIMKFWI